MVGNFQTRLKPFGIKVGELTGDSQMTKQQIALSSPHQKNGTLSLARVLIPAILTLFALSSHLLHDDRGPVLEAIIARTIRCMEQTNGYVPFPTTRTLPLSSAWMKRRAYSISTPLTGLVPSIVHV